MSRARKVNRYVDTVATYAPVLKRLRKLPPGARVIDVGSAEEGIGTWWRRPFVGVDLAFAGGHTAQLRPVVADATRLPFPDRTFDLVASVRVLESLVGGVADYTAELARIACGTVLIEGICGPDAEESISRRADWCVRRGYPVPDWVAKRVGKPLLDPAAVVEGLARFGRVAEGVALSTVWSERLFAFQQVMLRRLRGSTTAMQPVIRVLGRVAPFELASGGPPFERWFLLERD